MIGTVARTLTLAPAEAEVRRATGTRLAALARESRHVAIPALPDGGVPGYLRFPVLCSDAKWATLGASRRLGVMPGYPRALADLEGFASRVRNAGSGFPGARALARRLATVPTHSWVSVAERRELEEWVR
jgi:hypothetical protein